jgi:hypothetical protein
MPFQLPPDWYRKTASDVIDELTPTLGPLTAETAWRYLCCCVAWIEEIKGHGRFVHLNDRLSSQSGKALAKRGEQFLREHLVPDGEAAPEELLDQVARRYALERDAQGFSPTAWQRNNVTGAAFEATLQVLIGRISGILPSRTPPLHTLQGFEFAPVGYHSRPDLVLFSPSDFRLLISTKWTLRKERIGTYLHEAYFYRRRRPDLQVAFVVGEFNLNILEWLTSDPLVDRVYHLHLPMLLSVHAPYGDRAADYSVPVSSIIAGGKEVDTLRRWLQISDRLNDLSQLFTDIQSLQIASSSTAVDPDSLEAEANDD